MTGVQTCALPILHSFLSDRILVMYEGEIVGEFDPKTTTVQELGLYMAGARKQGKESK